MIEINVDGVMIRDLESINPIDNGTRVFESDLEYGFSLKTESHVDSNNNWPLTSCYEYTSITYASIFQLFM